MTPTKTAPTTTAPVEEKAPVVAPAASAQADKKEEVTAAGVEAPAKKKQLQQPQQKTLGNVVAVVLLVTPTILT